MTPTSPVVGSRPIRVLIVDDHPVVLEGLVARFETEADFDVVGSATGVDDALALWRELRPDVVLADLMLGERSALEILRVARQEDPSARFVILSMMADRALVTAAITEGAVGYMRKTVTGAALTAALRELVESGRPAVDFDAMAALAAPAPPEPASAGVLSPREREVLQLVARGATNNEIAEQLFLSPQTVKTHMSRMLQKLGVGDRAAAVAKAMRDGVIS